MYSLLVKSLILVCVTSIICFGAFFGSVLVGVTVFGAIVALSVMEVRGFGVVRGFSFAGEVDSG